MTALRRVQLTQDRPACKRQRRENLMALAFILLLIFADPLSQWVASLFK